MRQANDKLQFGVFRDYVVDLLKKKGRQFTNCDQCGTDVTKSFTLHHTKYEGATLDDIQVVCKKCNLKKENRLLI